MEKISLKDLLEAGCHFGHQSQRWNPKASSFIYSHRQGVHIIDLALTRQGLMDASEYIVSTLGAGGKIIFVGTKRQAKDIVKNEALRSGAYYIVERWPGGLLTNFDILKKNLVKMKDLKGKLINKELQVGYTKREVIMWEKELKKLENLYGGIAELTSIPSLIFVIDTKKEDGVIREARKTGVKIIGMVDTNSDPTVIDFPIPANDDAVGSIKIIVKYIADAVAEGMKIWDKKKGEDEVGNKLEVKSKIDDNVEVKKVSPEKSEVKAEKKPEKPKTKKKTGKK